MTAEELAQSPVIRMAGSDGHAWESTADKSNDMAKYARDSGVELKPFIKTRSADGVEHEISPFDGAGLKEAEDRGDERVFAGGDVKEDYFSAEALGAGATRFAIGLVNPMDWIRGIGTAAGMVARGFLKGTIGTAIRAFQGAAYLGESLTNMITGDDDHSVSEATGNLNRAFEGGIDWLTPDLFEKTGQYDGIEGAKEVAGTVRNVGEMVANLKGIGALTKAMQASGASAKAAHAATGALFGTGNYGEIASDPNGPGGWKQQAAALAAGSVEAVLFGLWNPFRLGAKAAAIKPFADATRREVTRRVVAKLAQAANSGLTMGLGVEGTKQTAEQLAGIGQEGKGTWGERTITDSLKEVGVQFLVGSGFVGLDILESIPGRISYARARRAQSGEDLSENMKVAMSYQVERNRKEYAPRYDAQAIYAFRSSTNRGQEGESFKKGLSRSPDVRRVNEDGSVEFEDGSVWRIHDDGSRTITVSDGTILDAETGALKGYRPYQEAKTETEKPDLETEKRNSKTQTPDSGTQTRPASNAMLLLRQIDEGALPVAEVETGAIQGIAPSENGNAIGEWDQAKAKPIVVLRDLEGNLSALTGGKRLAMAKAAGAEKINAVVVEESDGWHADMSGSLSAVENLREGRVTVRSVVQAAETLGAEQVDEIAGWLQAHGTREAASTARRGLAVATKASEELKTALAAGRVSGDFAYNAAMALSMERVGEGWEAAQRALVDLAGRVGPEELEAVLWGMRRRLGTDGAPADWGAMIAEERAKYNAGKGAAEGAIDTDTVLIETGEGELKTIGEIEAGAPRPGVTVEGADAPSPETHYGAAEGAAANKAVELRPSGDGKFTTLAFPDARIEVDGDAKRIVVRGLTLDDFAGSKAGNAAAFVARMEAFARENGLEIGLAGDGVVEAWEGMRRQIAAEAEAAFARRQGEERRRAVVDRLKASGLASDVVESAGEFNRLFQELSGEALKSGEEVYGFVDPKTKKIYLNPEFFEGGLGLETPIHEFGHLGVIAAEKVNKPVYDRGMALAKGFLENPETAGEGPVRDIVDFILGDRVYSGQGRDAQAQELLSQLIGKRGEEALRNETNKTVVGKIKSWLVAFWNTFNKALGLKDITPEEAAKMTIEDVADAIRAEMLSGRKYGEGLKGVEFADGGARAVTKPVRVKRKLTGRQKAVNDFVAKMGGAEDPANTETDMLGLWVDNGGRLFDKMPFEVSTGYSKGKTGVKKTRSVVADEFAESTAFYKDLNPAQRKVFFGTEKLESGSIGESLREKLEAAGITRFTREDGTVDYEAAIEEFQRQWTNYERGAEFLKERGEYEEARDRAYVEEMERAEAAADAEVKAQIESDIANGLFSRFAGEKGAANMGVGNADRARSMESAGADREKIWRETGWWKGKDGKWRFELPNIRRGSWHGDPEERHFTGGGDDFYRYRLTELVDNDDFFKAYPQGKKIKVEFHKNMPANVGGNFNEATLTIKLPQRYQVITDYAKYGLGEGKAAGLNAAGAKTMEHELQHAVQLFESFAKGGSPSDPVRPYALDGNTGHALSVFAEANGMDVTNDRHLAIIANTAQKITSDATRGEVSKRLVEAFEAAAKEAGKTPAEFSDEINRLYDSHTESPMGQYFKLAGEVEARNAQFRANMTPEERAATPPWETEDVPQERQLLFSRAVKPSALGDGKQRYYEVPFDKAVDKIVKNKKPVSRDHVFISETPQPFKDIGIPGLPVMMNQSHVLSCYFGAMQGVKAGNMHGLGEKLKALPRAIAKPMMIIANESNPSSSVIAIVKMRDNIGNTVIAPVEISGIGKAGSDLITANILKTAFGKQNIWSEKVAQALRDEVDGKVSVFYVDSNEAKTIENRLAREAFNFGKVERQLLKVAKGTVHSIADFGSPVKGVGAQKDSRQFKNWFGGSKVVDANGKPLVVYRRDNDAFTAFDQAKSQQNDAGWLGKGFYFYGDKGEAERATGYGKNLRSFYLKAENPCYITPEEYNRLVEADDPKVSAEFTQRLKDEGFDSVYWNGDLRQEWMVLDSNQIKSATDNIGTFDPGNNDIRYSRGGGPQAENVKLTRIADDAGAGERATGPLAASVELSRTAPTPLTTRGTRYVSLPVSEMHALLRFLGGHAEMVEGSKLGAAGNASVKRRKLQIAADLVGTVDKSDLAAEKAQLRQRGYFANEDPTWLATHSQAEARAERERGETALASRLEALSDRRVRGAEPGGMAAGRRVFADQLAKIVMAMPHGQPGVLGAMQTVGGALERRVRGNDAEAEAFLDWMEGRGTGNGQQGTARSPQERKAGMFAAFLTMPKEMETRARGWYDAIRSTIAGDRKLADAFRMVTVRSMSAEAHAHLEAELRKAMEAQTEAAIAKLRAEADEPIKAGGAADAARETVVLACDDRMGAAMVRVNAATRNYLAAQKKLMAAAKTPADKAAIKQQTDMFIGAIAQAKNQVEISRTAWERGHNNADARYLWRMVDLLNEATVRDGLKTGDLSLYLDQMRVIETKGLSGARGESARQAQLVLDAMKRRLGAADFAKVEAFAQKFHAIHEQELVNDPVLERVMGKATADYWRSQSHYVTTKRQFSPEELQEIEAARALITQGDTVVGQMFEYAGRPDATARLKGSFSDKQEAMSATFEKAMAVKKWLRRCDYVIELRGLLLAAKVEGVHDMPAGKNEFKSNHRYGAIGYMENGQRRTLVVPREIADGFKAQGDFNNKALKLCGTVNNLARQLWIDWNPVYWQRNISRNAGSMEMNMPGMRESVVKRGARFVFPGLAPVTEIAMTHLVRHMPEKMSLPLRRIWGEHTALFYAPKAKRMAMWLTDHNEMQKRLWEAERRGDLGTVQQMAEDRRDMLEALKANMLVGGAAGRMGGTTGFLDESVRTVGRTMAREAQDFAAKSKAMWALDAVNVFRKNAEQQVFEDVLAKFSAYLHDRAQFGKAHVRTAAESGVAVKKNVSIGEGERKGDAARTVQGLFQPFWNMVEKGVVRNVRAYRERPSETFQKAAWRIAPMILQGLVGSGAVAAWILKASDGDEAAAKSGPMGDVYRYARDAQRAYQNCSNYVRENYHVTPLWTDGYTSVVLGMPLTDEERLLKPIARFVTDAAAVASGTKDSLDVAKSVFDATAGVIAPDFKLAGALPTLLDDTVHALFENPEDYYTGGQKYDSDLWTVRNESWGMRGKFLAAMGKRLWNDFGGRNVLPVDRAGVDNGLGRAPGWVSAAVNDIPIASPVLRSFIKVQVGSPRRDAAEITEAEHRIAAVCRVHSKELFEMARREKRDISLDRVRYIGLLQKWQKAEGLSEDDLAKIEAKYINSWYDYEGAQYRAGEERNKNRAKAERLGLDAAHIWHSFD